MTGLVFGVWLVVACLVAPVLGGEIVGSFAVVEGAVDIMRGGALPAVAARVGDGVAVGDFIRTKSKARAEIVFKDGNQLKIAQRSRIDIGEYLTEAAGDRRTMSLTRGKVQATVTKAKGEVKANRFEIHTPNAVAGVRGTQFLVFHERNVTGILVKEGAVQAYNPRLPGTAVIVPAGSVTTIGEKRAPLPPRPATEAERSGYEKGLQRSAQQGASTEKNTAAAGSGHGGTEPSQDTALPEAFFDPNNVLSDTPTNDPVTTILRDPVPPPDPRPPISDYIHPFTIDTKPAEQSNQTTVTFTLSNPTYSYTYSLDGAPYVAFSGTISGLTDGVHSISFIGQEASGAATQPVSYSWTVDTVAPTVTLNTTPVSLSNQATATFSATTNDPTSTLSITLDGGVPQAFTGTTSLSGISDGTHVVQISATDAAGNVSNIASYNWTVDLIAPTVTLTTAPVVVTNQSTATFSVTTNDASATLSIALDGGAPQAFTGSLNLSGIADGTHAVQISAVDAAGNSSNIVSYSWTVDTVAPAITQVQGPLAALVNQPATFAVQSPESLAAVEYRLDGGAWQTYSGSLAVSSEGTHTVDFQGFDLAGNASSSVSQSVFVGSRDISLAGIAAGVPGGTAAAQGRVVEYADRSTAMHFFSASGSAVPTAAFSFAAGGQGDLVTGSGPVFDGFWQVSGTAALGTGTLSGSATLTYLGVDRLYSGSETLNGIFDTSGWSVKGFSTPLTSSPLGFVADIKVNPMYRLATIDPSSNLLTIVNQGTLGMNGLLGGPTGLWSAASAPFTLLGVYQGRGSENYYWQGKIASKNYLNGSIASYDGGSFSGFIGGGNLDTVGTSSGHLATLYVAPRGGGLFGAGLLTGSYSGSLDTGFWGGSGTINRLELDPAFAVDPATMAASWWTDNTVTVAMPVVTGPNTGPNGDNNAEGFLLDASLNISAELADRGDKIELTVFTPDPTFGVWQDESFGRVSGSNSDLVLIANSATGTVVSGKLVPDHLVNIVSKSGWGTDGSIAGVAYGFWGDWASGDARMLSGLVNGSYNAGLGTFGAIASGAWLNVPTFLSLTATQRQQAGFPGIQEGTTFDLSGSNALGSSVSLTNIRFYSHTAGDPLSLWATDTVSGTFTGGTVEGQQISLNDGSQNLLASFRMEHVGTSPVSGDSVWLAELSGQGETGSSFRSSFEGVAVGTYSGTTFTGTAAGISHPLTYFSTLGTPNLLRRFDGSSSYQFEGMLTGVFGGMSLWQSSDLVTSTFDIIGIHTSAPMTHQDYVFGSDIESYDVPTGLYQTADGGAYRGYLIGGVTNGVTYPTEPIDGRIAALYIDPSSQAGILAGKFSGYIDQNGIWQAHGDWYPVLLPAALGGVDASTLLPSNISTASVPVNVAQSGAFIGSGGGSIATPASITGNDWQSTRIISINDWGVWQLSLAGTYTGTTYDSWSYGLNNLTNGSRSLEGQIIGDRWTEASPGFAGTIHGLVTAGWSDLGVSPSDPALTGILVGETIGTFDPVALSWQTLATGVWLETNTFLALASTAAGQATLQKLNIPAFEIGSANLAGSYNSGTTVDVTIDNVRFFAPTAGGRPVIWASGNVSGTYTGSPAGVSIPLSQTGGANSSGITGSLSIQNFSGNKWGGIIQPATAGTVGTHGGILISGSAAGTYTGVSTGTIAGTAAGAVK